MTTSFFRLLHTKDKEASLRTVVDATNAGASAAEVFQVNPGSFEQVPGSPFAYWVSAKVRQLFSELSPFESDRRTVKQGLATADDFRFIRCWWEVPASKLLATGNGPDWRKSVSDFQSWCCKQTHEGKRWIPIAKGGTYAPFFDEPQMVVNWERDGDEMKRWTESLYDGTSWSRNIRNTDFYFRPGLTWPLRGSRLSAQAVPAGGCFSIAGKLATSNETDELFPLLGLMNSLPFDSCLRLSAGETRAQFEVGLIAKVPVPDSINNKQLTLLSREASRSATFASTCNECRHVFVLPALLQVPGATLASRIAAWQTRVADAERQLAEHQLEIDDIAFQLYGIEGADREAIELSNGHKVADSDGTESSDEDDAENEGPITKDNLSEGRLLVAAVASYAIGGVVGRWDLRFATGQRPQPELPDPFDPLPVCSPGMLQGPAGLPLPPATDDLQRTTDYPLRIDWDGILVDDSDHSDDIVRRVREVFEVIWPDRAEAIEQETSDILGVRELRDYFRKPGKGGFWDDHISRYSKSRRKAPIYWLLQSSKKNYAIWLYYHRLDKDLLFKALVNYVEPKIRQVSGQHAEGRGQYEAAKAAGASTKELKRLQKEQEKTEDFLSELRDFEDKLRRAANLHLEPDLNDGVVLNIAPLWELVPWKEAKKYWAELIAGKYEWSSIGKQLRQKGIVK